MKSFNVIAVDVNAQSSEQSPVDATLDHAPAPGRRKDTFVATLAHELRQPLSSMLAAVEVVALTPGTEAARRAADVMRRQLAR